MHLGASHHVLCPDFSPRHDKINVTIQNTLISSGLPEPNVCPVYTLGFDEQIMARGFKAHCQPVCRRLFSLCRIVAKTRTKPAEPSPAEANPKVPADSPTSYHSPSITSTPDHTGCLCPTGKNFRSILHRPSGDPCPPLPPTAPCFESSPGTPGHGRAAP